MPVRDNNAFWRCLQCGGFISEEDFGYDQDNRKRHWVSKKKTWSNRMQKHNFVIGGIKVVVNVKDLVKKKPAPRLQKIFHFKPVQPEKVQTQQQP